jgi:hypothetical protein
MGTIRPVPRWLAVLREEDGTLGAAFVAKLALNTCSKHGCLGKPKQCIVPYPIRVAVPVAVSLDDLVVQTQEAVERSIASVHFGSCVGIVNFAMTDEELMVSYHTDVQTLATHHWTK